MTATTDRCPTCRWPAELQNPFCGCCPACDLPETYPDDNRPGPFCQCYGCDTCDELVGPAEECPFCMNCPRCCTCEPFTADEVEGFCKLAKQMRASGASLQDVVESEPF